MDATEILGVIGAVADGVPVDLVAVRASVLARADQLGALAGDLDAAEGEDAARFAGFTAAQLEVLDVLERDGAQAAFAAWIDAASGVFGGTGHDQTNTEGTER